MEMLRVWAAQPGGRFRAGRFWPAAGALVARGELEDEAWEAILADPVLRVEPAETADDDAGDGPKAEIAAAIAGLPPEAFGADGKPKLDALRAALPNVKVTAALRDTVWAEAKAAPAA